MQGTRSLGTELPVRGQSCQCLCHGLTAGVCWRRRVLLHRRLIPGLTPAPRVPGGAEPAAQLSYLDRLCPPMPLDVFRVYDVSEVSQVCVCVCA